MAERRPQEADIRVLLIDDDEAEPLQVRRYLAQISHGTYALDWVRTYSEGLAAVQAEAHDICLVSCRLGPDNGIDLIRESVAQGCPTPLILLTGQDDYAIDLEAMQAGAADYIAKASLSAPLLERVVRYALERHRTWRDTEASQDRYRQLADNFPGIVMQVERGPDGTISVPFVNAFALRFLRRDPAEIASYFAVDSGESLVHPDDRDAFVKMLVRTRNSGDLVSWEGRVTDGQGSWRWFHGTCQGRESGGAYVWEGAFLDVHQRIEAEAQVLRLNTELENRVATRTLELQESEKRYRDLIEDSIQGIVIQRDGVPLFANRAFAEIFGYDSPEQMLALKSVSPWIAAHELERLKEHASALARGEDVPSQFEFQGVRRDGALIWLDNITTTIQWQGKPALASTMVDITENKLAEQRMRQAQRMESIGSMAAGIAHNINNILTPIIGYTNLAMDRLDPHGEAFSELQVVRRSADRAKTIVRQVLMFSHQSEGQSRPVDLAPLVEETVKLMESSLSRTIKVGREVAAGLPPVQADPSQISSVLMNLCINARDAMPDGGELKIMLAQVTLDQFGLYNGEVASGDYARISVIDTGQGIPEDDLSRVFEPFFTTKDVGKGTGLGLSAVYGIVRDHGGFVNVRSRLGEGTCFDVYLPLLPFTPSAAGDGGALPRVFVVTRDTDFSGLAKECLQELAHLECFANLRDAMAALRQSGPVGLVVIDRADMATTAAQHVSMIRALDEGAKVLLIGETDSFTPRERQVAHAIGERAGFCALAKTLLGQQAATATDAERGEPRMPYRRTMHGRGDSEPANPRFDIQQGPEGHVIHIVGEGSLTQGEIDELLRQYTHAERDRRPLELVCGGGVYEYLTQIGFNRFLRLTRRS